MKPQISLESLTDYELTEFAAYNVDKQYEGIITEMSERLLGYSDLVTNMAAIMGISVEHFCHLVQMTGDPEFDVDKYVAVCKKLAKELYG